MKRKILATILSTALCVSMLGTTCFAGDLTTAGDTTEITGDNKVEMPVYKVVVPTTLSFAVDAFEQKGNGQIFSKDLAVTNKSNIPVKVTVGVKLSTSNDVAFETSEDDVKTTDTDKSLFIQAAVAKTAAESPKAGANYVPTSGSDDLSGMMKSDDNKYYISSDLATTLAASNPASVTTEMVDVDKVTITLDETPAVAKTLGTAEQVLTFALAPAEYIDYFKDASTIAKAFKATAAGDKGTGAFGFTGSVNPNVIWADSDFTATATYSFRGMTTSDYSTFDGARTANAWAYLDTTPAAPADEAPSFATGAYGIITFDAGSGDLALDEITKIEMTLGGNAYDGFNGNGTWQDATVGTSSITFDSAFMTFYTTDTEATITYTNVAGDTETATVTVDCTND